MPRRTFPSACPEEHLSTLRKWAAPGAPDRSPAARAAALIGVFEGLTYAEAVCVAGACVRA
ncbi:MAG: hypothetical protein LBQ12_12770 [Deltaproteobacteria bacterium]|nr:hypothetical protein [Deltaproteobacteria bacterium]